jgi:hypothetical protein
VVTDFSLIAAPLGCSWGGGGGECCGRPGQQSQSGGKFGGKMNILNEKIDFRHPTNFKLLSRIYENLNK